MKIEYKNIYKKLEKYQIEALKTAQYIDFGRNDIYPKLGLAGEVGELCNKIKKILRGDYNEYNQFNPELHLVEFFHNYLTDKFKQDLKKEIGDIFWYLSVLMYELRVTFKEINEYPKYNYLPVELYKEDLYESCLSLIQQTANITYMFQNNVKPDNIDGVIKELLFISGCFDLKINDILQTNVNKLQKRQKKNKIKGSGDNR